MSTAACLGRHIHEMTAAKTFRLAAVAALTNANQLCAEARLLAENEHNSRAAALAVIGLEEFAKAVACTVAAIFPEKSSDLGNRLNAHNVKQWIYQTFEGIQIQVQDWLNVVPYESGAGSPIEPETILLETFRTLSKSRWGSVVPTKNSADSAAKQDQKYLNDPRMHARPTEIMTTPFIKNVAFYVDVKKGEVLLPNRVDRYANYEIHGLTWSLEHSSPLKQILSDDHKWEAFADAVRRTPGAGLSIEAEVLTPKKTAIKQLRRLPETATWDQIKKEIERGAQEATEERKLTS